MTLKQYFESITGTAEQRQYLDQICKQSARGFLLSSLGASDITTETVTEVLRTFTSVCRETSFLDAAKASKLIDDGSLEQTGIVNVKTTMEASRNESH